MPAVSLATLPTIPYVYSGTTPAATNTCQLVTLPNRTGVRLVIHNRDKASKPLRMSFDSTLTQDGAAPSMWFTVEEPLEVHMNHAATSGYQHSVTIALFSSSASVNYELLFMPS
jgi:hypothetical protein